VGLGTSDPDTSAILDLNSTTKGLLIPRMNTTQRLAISSPEPGLLVFDTDTDQFHYYNNESWITFLGNKYGINFNDRNVALGDSALINTNSNLGLDNNAIGWKALYSNTTGYENIGIGKQALFSNTNGSRNIAIGLGSLRDNTNGSLNVALGYQSLQYNNGDYNTAVGQSSMKDNSSGSSNTAVGSFSLARNTTGSSNCAIGNLVLKENTSGQFNAAVGYRSMEENRQGTHNVAMGSYALHYSNDGSENSAFGAGTLIFNSTGSGNTGIGRSAATYITTGSYNKVLGYDAGDAITTGNHNTAVGYDAGVGVGGGAWSNTTAIGYNATVLATNRIVIGHTSINQIGGYEPFIDISDGRFKKDVHEDVPGLEFIRLLRPVTYHLDVNSIADHIKEDYKQDENGNIVYVAPDQALIEARQEKSEKLNTGFIAQEVEAAAKQIGYDFYGVRAPVNEIDHYGLSYALITVPLVKAVQELSLENETLKAEVISQTQTMLQLGLELETLKAEIQLIKALLQD
ncbi:MAG: tail fiber domain-containing protein, partial [Flavobacteriales bacterium]|nr:tail fiber domain-containing protein [Flavobacteriales bacterium]